MCIYIYIILYICICVYIYIYVYVYICIYIDESNRGSQGLPGRRQTPTAKVDASGVKDSYEGEVFTDRGTPQGTILVKVKHIYAAGSLGRFFVGDLQE